VVLKTYRYVGCCSVAEIAQLDEEVKEMEITIEREKEEHKALMIEKQKEYEETEQELTANNQEICVYTCMHHTFCTLFVIFLLKKSAFSLNLNDVACLSYDSFQLACK